MGRGAVSVSVKERGTDALAASGSGVIWQIEEDGLWIVTAGHVLERAGGENRVCVDFGGVRDKKMEVPCRLYEVSGEADLAFLYLTRSEIPQEARDGFETAKTDKAGYDGLRAGDSVYAAGYEDGSLTVCEGVLEDAWIYVEDFEQYMILAECGVRPGMSGGGLYDGAGRLIGIVCGGNEQGELAAVPLHVAQARFADLKSSFCGRARNDR